MSTSIHHFQNIYHFVATLSIICAGIWFFITNKYKQRIQFDIESNFIRINDEESICEIQLIIENKGFLEYKIYDLALSVKGLPVCTNGDVKKDLDFTSSIFKTKRIVNSPNYYFVRPGVKQIIVHNVKVHHNIRAINVLGGFTYKYNKKWEEELIEEEKRKGALCKKELYVKHNHPHRAARIFIVPQMKNN
ncbi:MAG: hypothetical protein K8S13_10230 [Desulfobacula sp.]|uniref:hypothetical protein n=1 Tax=Desulfobacula sp. TaxID=2593537 RepID=UPI0025B87BF7|nr:hypothetical protein [Desulfobacula sp.]MCD4720219.1 hypothetical protein [Desulfobacula sp.]